MGHKLPPIISSMKNFLRNIRPVQSRILNKRSTNAKDLFSKPIKELNQKDITLLLSSLSTKNRYDEMENLLSKIDKEKFNSVNLDCIIRYYFDSHNVSKAEEYIQIRKNTSFTKVDFLIILRGYSFNSEIEKLEKTYQEYVTKFGKDYPSFAFLILGYARKMNLEKVKELLNQTDLLQSLTYEQIIHFMVAKDLDFCFWLLKDMLQKNLEPTIEIYNQILNELFKRKKIKEAEEFYSSYTKDGQRPNLHTYIVLLRSYLLIKDLKKLEGVVLDMKKAKMKLNSLAATLIAKAQFLQGNFDFAKILDGFKRQGVEMDEFLFSQAIYDLVELKKVKEAKGVLEIMKQNAFIPSLEIIEFLKDK